MAIKTGDRFTVVVDVLEARDQGNVAFRIGGTTCIASAKALEAAKVPESPEVLPETLPDDGRAIIGSGPDPVARRPTTTRRRRQAP